MFFYWTINTSDGEIGVVGAVGKCPSEARSRLLRRLRLDANCASVAEVVRTTEPQMDNVLISLM